jgi:hypothetical protein
MFLSAGSFIVFQFTLSFTICFGLHGHLQVCRILHTFIFICLKEVGWGDVDSIGLAQDRGRWRALVNSVLNLQVP